MVCRRLSLDKGAISTWASFLRECGTAGESVQARQLHAQLVGHGLDGHTFLGNSVVQMYGDCGCPREAFEAFGRIGSRNVFSWTILLTAFLQNGHLQEAKQTFNKMASRGLVSWNAMVSASGTWVSLTEAKQLFDSMPCRDVVSWNALLALYARTGDFDQAVTLFYNMPVRNVTSWNIVIVAYAQSGQVAEAKLLFDRIPQRSVVSWNEMIAACGQSGGLDEAKAVFDSSPELNIYSWTIMVAAYGQNGRVDEAKAMFDRVVGRNVVSWNAALTAYIQADRAAEARQLFDKMPQWDLVSWNPMIALQGNLEDARSMFDIMPSRDLVSWNSLLTTYAQLRFVKEAEEVFARFPKLSILACNVMVAAYAENGQLEKATEMAHGLADAADTFTWTILLVAHAQNDQLLEARRTFDFMAQRNLVTWNAMLGGYVQAGQPDLARSLFDRMPKRDVVTWNTMVIAYVDSGRLDDAKETFGKTPDRSTSLWNIMIRAYCKNEQARDAIDLFHEMDVPADQGTVAAVLEACAKLGDMEEGKSMHSLATKMGWQLQVGTALIDMYGRSANLEAARLVFDGLAEQHHQLAPWNEMIKSYSVNGRPKEAAMLFQEMLQAGVEPDYLSFIHVVAGCSHGGLEKDALQHLLSIEVDHGQELSIHHYLCLVDLLARSGRLDLAEEVVEKMPYEPVTASWMTLLSACKLHCDETRGNRAADKMKELEPGHGLPYVILSNIHVLSG